MTEAWKTIETYPDYEVSSMGRVRRQVHSPHATRQIGDTLRPCPNRKGYLRVCLRRNGEQNAIEVHALVATAFIGQRQDGMQVNHIDGCKTNNRLENLEYVTGAQNIRHAQSMGLLVQHSGSKHANSILTESDVDEIIALEGKATCKEIANRFGVSKSTIHHIFTGRLWHNYTGRAKPCLSR